MSEWIDKERRVYEEREKIFVGTLPIHIVLFFCLRYSSMEFIETEHWILTDSFFLLAIQLLLSAKITVKSVIQFSTNVFSLFMDAVRNFDQSIHPSIHIYYTRPIHSMHFSWCGFFSVLDLLKTIFISQMIRWEQWHRMKGNWTNGEGWVNYVKLPRVLAFGHPIQFFVSIDFSESLGGLATSGWTKDMQRIANKKPCTKWIIHRCNNSIRFIHDLSLCNTFANACDPSHSMNI